jgi:hypothetical protein
MTFWQDGLRMKRFDPLMIAICGYQRLVNPRLQGGATLCQEQLVPIFLGSFYYLL